jgi:hypothetical protein
METKVLALNLVDESRWCLVWEGNSSLRNGLAHIEQEDMVGWLANV